MRHGFIMLTALPPTRGHVYLIEWAWRYCQAVGIQYLEVMVCGQPHEPITAEVRANAIRSYFYEKHLTGITVISFNKTMPQEPKDDPEFWEKWCDSIRLKCNLLDGDIVFASEMYGYELAKQLNCEFIPCNIYRETVQISGSRVRNNPIRLFNQIIPQAQSMFRKTITVFGPESTGKTTTAKRLAEVLEGHYSPEWAREFLETRSDPTALDEGDMQTIVNGQWATQETVHQMVDKPFVIQDTDLLSTIGFYNLYKWNPQPAIAKFIKADHYLLMKDNIPFVPDVLRYGGDKRETNYRYWENLLIINNCSYTIIDKEKEGERIKQAIDACEKVFKEHPMWNYKRYR